jgi:hypothetical protein
MDRDAWDYFIYACQRILFILLLLAAVFGFFIGSYVHGQDGYYPEDRGETLAEERARIDAQKTRFAYIPQHSGPMFDGVCRLSVDGKQWSGVAISDTHILTIGHHGETGIVRAEFAENEHGTFNRLGIQAKILRTHKLADLSLLEYNPPRWAKIRSYSVKDRKSDRVRIRGYVSTSPRVQECTVSTGPVATVDGFKVLTLNGDAVSGMSGSGVFEDDGIVGIQFGGNRDSIDAVTVETIQMFLKE